MNDYHSNFNTWDRCDPVDPHTVRCRDCNGLGYYHADDCSAPTPEDIAQANDGSDR